MVKTLINIVVRHLLQCIDLECDPSSAYGWRQHGPLFITEEIDLLHLSPEYVKLCVLKSPSASRTDVEVLVNQVTFEEPLISDNRKPQLRRLIYSTKIRLCPDNFTNLSQNWLKNLKITKIVTTIYSKFSGRIFCLWRIAHLTSKVTNSSLEVMTELVKSGELKLGKNCWLLKVIVMWFMRSRSTTPGVIKS